MDARRFQQLEQFYARAATASAQERERILAEASALDAEVGRELARLLAIEPACALLDALVERAGAGVVAAGSSLEGPPELPAVESPSQAASEFGVDPADASLPTGSRAAELIEHLAARGPRASRYLIRGEVARGGMGAILRAFDPDLRRVLAMKVVLESAEPLADERHEARVGRFLEEAQITGQLDHPGIVPVHEIGLDAHGRPYFTMRLVGGHDLGTIYDLARKGELGWSTTRILGVLLKVCDTVAYAHSRGVIHRDLKPANVMVGRFGEVYVMDWGLAKVLGETGARDLRVRAPAAGSLQSIRSDECFADPTTPLMTMDGTVLGTPAYMSPEQASGEVAAMDVRSDVYALGAMLYHVAAGRAPYHEDGATIDAYRLLQQIATTPPAPLAVVAPSAPPELVAIVEQAMARAMADRYPSVMALADDLRAYVEGRVVGAYQTGSWAELRKWIGRNKALSASLAAAVLAVAIGAIGFAIKADQATKAASIASIARGDAETSALAAKRSEAAATQREAEARASERRAQQVTQLVQAALTGADPNQGGAQGYTVTDAMDRVIADLDRGMLAGDPETEASLQLTIAEIMRGNGRAEDALRLAQRALETRQRLFPGDHVDVASALRCVGLCLHAVSRFPEALSHHEAALAMRRLLFFVDHGDVASSLGDTSNCLMVLGRNTEALERAEAALAMQRRLHPGDHMNVAASVNDVAVLHRRSGHDVEALPMLEEAAAMLRRLLPGDHPNLSKALGAVGLCLQSMGKYEDALPQLQAALAMRQRVFAGDHPDVAMALASVGTCLLYLDRGDEAQPHCEAALAMQQRLFSGDHRDVANSLAALASCLKVQGKAGEALPHYEAALEMWRRLHGGDHFTVANALTNLASCLVDQGRFAEAETHLAESLAMNRRLRPDGAHRDVAWALNTLASCLHKQGKPADALPHFRESLDVLEQVCTGDHPSLAMTLGNLSACLHALNRSAEAMPYAERANDMAARIMPAEHATRKSIGANLEKVRAALHR